MLVSIEHVSREFRPVRGGSSCIISVMGVLHETRRTMESNRAIVPPALENVNVGGGVHQIFIVRYVALASIAILFYDTFLTIGDEIRYVWLPKERSRTGKYLRLVFVMNKVGILLTIMLYFFTILIPVGSHSENWCGRPGAAVILLHIVTSACGDGLVLYIGCRAWSWRSGVIRILVITFIIIYGIDLSFSVRAIHDVIDKHAVVYLNIGDALSTCFAIRTPSGFPEMFGVVALLDVYSFIFLSVNPLARPRNVSESYFRMLLKDGILFFLTSLITKLANVVIILKVAPPFALLGTCLGLTLSSLVASRLYIRTCEANYRGIGFEGDNALESHELECRLL